MRWRTVIGGRRRETARARFGGRPLAIYASVGVLLAIVSACFLSLPWMLGGSDGGPRYNAGQIEHARIPPMWIPLDVETFQRLNQLVPSDAVERIAAAEGMEPEAVMLVTEGAVADRLRAEHPKFLLGADALGRSVFRRALVGGAVSLGVGIGASLISVVVGSLYGAVAGLAGGRVDAVMMRVVDVLYGLPYVLLVVLIAVASDAAIDDHVGRSREREAWLERQAAVDPAKATLEAAAVAVPARRLSAAARSAIELAALLVAIGAVSWLTLARVIRGEVLSLKTRAYVEAARVSGASGWRVFFVHLLPGLMGPILVYGALTAPQAMLQEGFLSFLGIGVQPPIPSWGSMAAEGLSELNPYRSRWWLLATPSVLLAVTLLGLNYAGEAWRERVDPKRVTA